MSLPLVSPSRAELEAFWVLLFRFGFETASTIISFSESFIGFEVDIRFLCRAPEFSLFNVSFAFGEGCFLFRSVPGDVFLSPAFFALLFL